jgi:pilus assembly protein CpaD
MRSALSLLLLSAAIAGCQHTPNDLPDRGVAAVNAPVVTRANYVLDVAAPGGALPASEAARLDGWFRSLGLRYGDMIYVDAPYGDLARADIERVAGQYGLLVTSGAPVTAGPVQSGNVRVIVSRTEAVVPNCPDWERPSSPDFNNRSMPNFGCGVNSNLAAMVANPEDLIHGREGDGSGDAMTASKAVGAYWSAKPTGTEGLQDISTKKGDK